MEAVETTNSMRLDIFSPERRLVENAIVEEVVLSGSEGQIEILPGHASMMGSLEPGIFMYKVPSKPKVQGFISTGFFEISGNRVKIMAETLELREEIDILRAKVAQKKAEENLSEASLDDYKLRKYQLKLQRSIIRQQLTTAKD